MPMEMRPVVAAGKVVSIHYSLTNDEGEVLDGSMEDRPLVYLHGASNVVPGLERGLAGRSLGDKLEVRVAPEHGYGERNPRGVQCVPRAAFPADIDLESGMQFGAENERGERTTVWIQRVQGDEVTIDQNHPLAGKTLHFEVTIAAIRDATGEEMAHGHPHEGVGQHP